MAKNEYEGEWIISTPANPNEFKIIVTPSFVPFSGKNLEFQFEASYQSYHSYKDCYDRYDDGYDRYEDCYDRYDDGYDRYEDCYDRYEDCYDEDRYVLKLKLVKLSNVGISPTLEVLISVNYSDGSIFKEYPCKVLTSEMNNVTFRNVTGYIFVNGHYNKMSNKTLTIKCKMRMQNESRSEKCKMNQDQTSHTTGNERKSCKCVDVIRNLKSIYEQSVFSDFVFKVGDKSFPVHKNILSAHSPVFMKMMTHDFMESKTNSVTITDAAPEVFELFLRSLYAGELENKSWDSLKELYYLVDKYDVGFLKVECTDAVISLLSVDLVCEILKLAYSFSNSDLKTAAINFAVNHIKKIVLREDWKELVKTHPIIGYDVTVNFIPK